MNFSEALYNLKDGKEIYNNLDYTLVYKGEIVKMKVKDNPIYYYNYNFTQDDIFCENWEVKDNSGIE